MMDAAEIPHRRWTALISVGADSLRELEVALDEIAQRVAFHGPSESPISCTSGSSGSGWHMDAKCDPAVTHESYFAAIHDWKKTRCDDAQN